MPNSTITLSKAQARRIWLREKVQEFRNEMLKRFEHGAREEAST